ncbi:MAG: alpha-2-macroglobulin family protein [Spirochaetaceae bacterium]|nr:alpha-2-macroglobulin family protein [Spirochaetaceae bacterium]
MKNFRFDDYYDFNENNIAESEYSEYRIKDSSVSKISYFSYDFSDKLNQNLSKNLKNGLFLFQVANTDSYLDSASPRGLYDKRLILITDLGFFVKRNDDNTKEVFVQSISSGLPVANAEVSVIGLNGNPVFSGTTDRDGHIKLPSTAGEGYTGEHKPVAYVVKTSNDLSFMPYSAYGRSLDYSNFDIGGVYGVTNPKKVTAFMFCDRGEYRPGDTVNLGIIAKAGDWNINLAGIPLEAEVIDSNGAVIFNKKLKLSSSGFEEIKFATQDYSPTGVYKINLYLLKEYTDRVERQFLTSETIKVEEFLPDTLSLSVGFNPIPEKGWINPDKLDGTVSVKNLFGTPAAGNTVKAQITLSPGFPVLYKYSDYYFSDPYYKGKSFEEFLGSQTTDEKGETVFNIDVKKYEKATYNLSLYVEAFEKGSGRNVSQQSSVYVSPLKYLIGYKADGSLSYINKNSERKLTFIAIDQKLDQIDLSDVTMQIEEIKYISTLVKQNNGLYKYQSVKKYYPLSSEQINISKEGTEIFLKSDVSGEYKITLINNEGLVFNTINYTIVGEENISRSLTRTAELDIKLEKSDLSVGSKAKVFIKAPYEGSGLITVERDKVYSYKWFTTKELSTVQTIDIPEGLEGNAYINVMFSRSVNSDEIFMSPFCYGAVSFSIDKENRTNKIKIEVPEEIKSGTDLTIKYSSSHAGKIILYAVDEGILQLAKYKLPNPISYFFQKRALEVQTYQIMDLVLPEYNILKTLSATGGGAGMDMLAKNLNPFKRKQNAPVVYWSGIMETGPQTRTVTYRVPDYFNGSIRIMAVSVSNERMGTAQTATVARNTFIIVPNVPLAVAPGDEFDVAVTVTNNHKGSGENNNVELIIEPTENLEVVGESSVKMNIAEGKDSTVTIRVKAKDGLGNAELKFIAKDSSEQSVLTSTMSIRPSMPYQVRIKSGLSNRKSVEMDVNFNQYPQFEEKKASVSNVPASFIDGLQFFLEKYPYGCSEQITSKAYPYLYEDFVKAAGKTRADAEEMVNKTISIIQSRMKSNGNIGYWTSKSPEDYFITLYCAEFLTDAQNKGFYVPESLYSKVMKAVKSIANTYQNDSYNIYLRSYAIYVLTKNEIITTKYIESLENDITRKNYTPTDYEGLYLAASYQMMQQYKKAQDIMAKIVVKKVFDSSWFYHNDLHYISTYIEMISTYFPEMIGQIKAKEINMICDYLTDSNYSTYSTSAAIRAFETYANQDKSETYKIYEIVGETQKELELSGQKVLKGDFSPEAEKILFTNDSKMPMYYQAVVSGYEKEIPTANIKAGLEVNREYIKDSLSSDKSKDIKVGDTIIVKISFRSTGGTLRNIALVDLTPAGFEADIESIREADNSWKPDYVDIREDRVVIYGTVTDKINTFTYKAKAVNSGKFVVPPMFAESMYNKDIRALSVYKPIEIAPAK